MRQSSMQQSRPSPSPQFVIAIADDDPAVRNSLKFSLEIEGFAVSVHPDGTSLVNDARLANCSCIIVDQNMPGLTGIDVAAQLGKRGIKAPVILITSHPTAELAQRAKRAGIRIVEKPLLDNALIDTIRKVLGNKPA